jgi:crotonobetainyl-CoA:carnitine CoA-transferase CaiB-like acyl-CoA transferase
MAALHYRERTGEGQHVEIPQVESAASMVGTAILEYTINGTTPQPWGNRDPNFAPQNLYPCLGHDRWCAISCQTNEHWQSLCSVMNSPSWANDPRFSSLANRLQHHDEIDSKIADWTREFTPHQIMLKCQAAGIPAGVVATGEDLYLDPHLRERDYIVEIDHPAPGRLEHPGMTIRLIRTPGQVRLPAPLTGQHNEEVFAQLLNISKQDFLKFEKTGALA